MVDALIYLPIAMCLKIVWTYEKYWTNYNELNKIFVLDDPIQIHTMFNYLSVDKN